ncbi:MAG TPA: general secretion pathway protein GspK [Verrucomicrobiae bacterium]|jgi:general secretion pathway protein K|nr:general secretion pathway protein GspK [Verrucomicrobiae bacterium]
MKITLRQTSDGIAIFIVLISVMALTAMAFVFASQMKVETKLAMNSNNESELEWLGRSGIELARYTLAQEISTPGPGQRFDALNQKWADGPADTNDVLAGISLDDIPLGNGFIRKVKITDNERKVNINTAVNNEALMTQAMILIGVDASEIPTIIGSIQDWIDPDDETHVNGAESDYYQTLDPPYFAKNAPIDDLSELLLIKGINSDIYFGPNSTNHPPSRFQGRSPDGNGLNPTSQATVGMVDVFTPISSGLININTASATTLRMIGMDEATADKIISLRAGPDGVDGTEDDMPFSNVGEIINAGLPSQIAQQFMSLLTVRSSTFEVEVDVEVGQSHRKYFATLRRDTRNIQILGMRWE